MGWACGMHGLEKYAHGSYVENWWKQQPVNGKITLNWTLQEYGGIGFVVVSTDRRVERIL
jgi:hypothetical protein